MKVIFIYVPVSSLKEAKKISQILLKKRLISCVNIVPAITSLYWWKGRLETSKEVLMILKTEKGLFSKVESEVKKNHSYSCPCIAQIDIKKISSEYKAWLLENLA